MFVQIAVITVELLFLETACKCALWVNTMENDPSALFMCQNPKLVPRVLSFPFPEARERERTWKTLVTCLPDSGRLVTSIFQGLSLSLAPGNGKKRTLETRLSKPLITVITAINNLARTVAHLFGIMAFFIVLK